MVSNSMLLPRINLIFCFSISDKVLGKNMELWEQQVYQFAKLNQLCAISPYVPTGDLRLPKYQYEMILNEFLQKSDLEV